MPYASGEFGYLAALRLLEKRARHAGGNHAIAQAAPECSKAPVAVAFSLERIDRLYQLRRRGPVGIQLVKCSEAASAKRRVNSAASLLFMFALAGVCEP